MYNPSEISAMIKLSAKKKNLTIKQLLEDCGINKGFIYALEHQSVFPSCDKISRIADYLDVSVDYLLGRSNQENVSRETYTLSPLEEELIQSFRKLSPESQYTVAKTVGYCSTLPNVTETTRNDEPEQTQTQIQIAARNGDFITADGDATERKFSAMPPVDDLE